MDPSAIGEKPAPALQLEFFVQFPESKLNARIAPSLVPKKRLESVAMRF
jgi:hypothetical protein